MTSDERPLLVARNLTKHFRGRDGSVVRAVDGVDLTLERGEALALVGESGCGKSTTARMLVGLHPPTSGSILLDGVEVAHLDARGWLPLRHRVQMVFQDPYSSLDPRQTVGSILAEPLTIHGLGKPRERRLRALALLELVGLDPRCVNRYPHEFSGGQRQRIGIARALTLEPDLLVLDEPVSALDVSIQAQVINLLARLRDRFGLTYLFIAHDLAVVRQLCDRIAVMYLGRVVETAPCRELFKDPRHPYTRALLSAVPIPDPAIEGQRQRIVLQGDVPSPSHPPTGCAFHPRCPEREQVGDRCVTERPELLELAKNGDPLGDPRCSACHLST